MNDIDQIGELFFWLIRHSAWNPHANFIIRSNNLKQNQSSEYLFELLSEILILNVVVVNYEMDEDLVEVFVCIYDTFRKCE